MGDHATNIAETVYFMIEGRPIADQRPKGDTTTISVGELRSPARMKPHILIVEDEEALTLLLRYNLEAEGYEVETVARGDDADVRLKERMPDMVILDWMLPGISGIELCRRLRARPETRQLPIIMLTARGEESERVRGLSTGADDYIVKPFSVPELSARVRALLRRAIPERVADVLSFGDIEVDREKKRVSRNGRVIDLGPTEYRLLEFLMERPGPRVLARATARRRLGQRHLYRRAHRRRPCRPPAQGDQPRPRLRPDPHRARLGLRARRPVRQDGVAPPSIAGARASAREPGIHNHGLGVSDSGLATLSRPVNDIGRRF